MIWEEEIMAQQAFVRLGEGKIHSFFFSFDVIVFFILAYTACIFERGFLYIPLSIGIYGYRKVIEKRAAISRKPS